MDKKKYGVHTSHCCALHGCKYRNDDCPVVNKIAKQEYTCESCREEGYEDVHQVQEHIDHQHLVTECRRKDEQTITISVDFLDRLLKR